MTMEEYRKMLDEELRARIAAGLYEYAEDEEEEEEEDPFDPYDDSPTDAEELEWKTMDEIHPRW